MEPLAVTELDIALARRPGCNPHLPEVFHPRKTAVVEDATAVVERCYRNGRVGVIQLVGRQGDTFQPQELVAHPRGQAVGQVAH